MSTTCCSAAASRAGSPYDRFAAIQQFYFDRDMAALGVAEPALQPRAHTFIGQVIALGQPACWPAAPPTSATAACTSPAPRPPARPGLDRDAALRLSAEYGDRPDDPRQG